MSRTARRHPIRNLFLFVLLALVVAVGGFSVVLYQSMQRLGNDISQARDSYEACLSQVESQQYQDALVSIRSTAASTARAREELTGWQWDLTARLPLLGDDVACARDTIDVADTLATTAMLPLLDQAEDIWGDVTSDDILTTLPDTFSKLGPFYQTFTETREVVASCKAKADALPDAHYDKLDELVAGVRDAASGADEAFGTFDPLITAIDTMGDLASTLTAPFQTQTPTTSA